MNVFKQMLAAPRGAMLVLLAFALLNRLALIAAAAFDGLYGQDAYAYYAYARALFEALTHFQAPPPFVWPAGYPTLLSAGFVLGGVNVTTAQMTTLLCGALVAPFAFALAYEAAPHRNIVAAWVAGLLCACSGQLAQSSVVIMSDAPALMFATLAAWLLLRYGSGDWKSQQQKRETSLRTFEVVPDIGQNAANSVHRQHARATSLRTLGFAAVACGMAVWMRWQYLIFAAVWFVTLAAVEWRAARISKASVARFFLAAGLVALASLPQIWIQATTRAPLAGQSWLQGWSPTNFFAQKFDNIDGHFAYALPVAVFYGQVFAHPAYLFVMLTPFLTIGVITLLKRKSSLLYVNVLLLGWIFGMLFFLMGIPYENFRFPLGLLAPLAVVAGIGAGWVWARWSSQRAHTLMTAWIFFALCIMLYWQPRVLAPVLETKAREMKHVRWLETQLPPRAFVYTMSIDGAVREYTNLRVENLWNMEPGKLNPDTPTYLYADTHNIETQWRGKIPDQLVRGLQEKNVLRERGRFEGWTLWEIGE